MPKKSAGILLYRITSGVIHVFLVHPGGPFWARKDDGAWSIPKGEFAEGEDPLAVAMREFREETSFAVEGECHPLAPLRQPSGKIVYAWAVQGDVDAAAVKSNSFVMEWPSGSGKMQEFPEIDRASWFTTDLARRKILRGQAALLEQLEEAVAKIKMEKPTSLANSHGNTARGQVPEQGSLFQKRRVPFPYRQKAGSK